MKKRCIVLICLLALVLWVLWGNTALEVNEWRIQSDRLPEAFDGFRFAQVSDLHNTKNEKLLPLLEKAEPDVIVLTGDLIDSRNTDVAAALDFVREAVKIAPCYYVSGNHESRVPERYDLWAGLQELGVMMLDNASAELSRGGECIRLIGLADPDFGGNPGAVLEELTGEDTGFTVLLSHRPELFDVYTEFSVDLVFSGHAHGGQFRLPILGGLVAPHQGLFPEYDAGLFTENGTAMLVGRGVGNSIIPIRFNNRPEIILAVLVR